MKMMPWRVDELQATVDGNIRSGVPLVNWNGTAYGPAGFGDDPGIYYAIPIIARALGLGAEAATQVFFALVFLGATAVAIAGIWRLCRTRSSRWFGVGMVSFVALAAMRGDFAGDVYVVSSYVVLALVPWFLVLTRAASGEPIRFGRFLPVALVLAGLALGLANLVRLHSGTLVLGFFLLALALHLRLPRQHKALAGIALVAGMLIPGMVFGLALQERDSFLARELPGYEPVPATHPTWHSIYISLGYLSNEHGLAYDDGVGERAARAVDPDVVYASAEYEAILRAKTIAFVTAHPRFVLETLFAKAGVMFPYFVAFANVGLVAAYYYRKPWGLEAALLLAVLAASVPGFLGIPRGSYLLGFFAFAAMYAVLSIDEAASRGAATDAKRAWSQARRRADALMSARVRVRKEGGT